LILCGAGHVAHYLAKFGIISDFDVTVIDDREDLMKEERFEGGINLICSDFTEYLNNMNYNENSYYVIVTRNHKIDEICLQNILRTPFAYIGMIGSRRKISTVKSNLLEKGFTKAQLNNVCMPIGIDIGARTPAEIAICILAQIIEYKNKINKIDFVGESVLCAMLEEDLYKEVTLINRLGSAPRKAGAKLVLKDNGDFMGTIGGGKSEGDAIRAAINMTEESDISMLDLAVDDSKKTNMACGGEITVLINRVN
jgi:xanthine dehydrogenase accessory factor